MMKKFILSLGALFIAIVFIFCTSFSWFTDENTKKTTIDGSTPTAYYKSGDGTKDNPYIIAKPIHLYNFAWLQYLGTYNKTENGNLVQTYFKIESEDTDKNGNAVLDMSSNPNYSVLPPIGTEANPFVGNFDGNNTIVKGLTTSSNSSDFKSMPASVKETDYNTTNQVHLLGFFGYIGQASTSYTGYVSSINTVSNLYLDNYSVKNTNTTNVLVGLLAGYVNAQINNSGVISGQFDLISGTTSYSSYGSVSKYTLVGDYNEKNFDWKGKPSGSGQDNDFGGSIDFASISKRLTYIIDNKDSTSTDSSGTLYTSNTFNSKIYIRSNQTLNPSDYSWDAFKAGSNSMQTAFLEEETYLPLNIDEEIATINITDSTRGSYYSQKKAEPILNTNTGYLVGADSSTGATPRIQHRAINASTGIPYSIATHDNPSKNTFDSVFNLKNYSFFYVDSTQSSPSTKRIIDSDNTSATFSHYATDNDKVQSTNLNFVEYNSVKKNFVTSLQNATPDSVLDDERIILNSILFNKSSKAQTTVTKSNVTIKDSSKITTYNNYAFLTGGLNFSLSKQGIMTFISANMTGSSRATLPPLLKLERSSDKSSFTSIKQIYKIYKSVNTYQYTYNNDDTIEGGTLVVDLYKMTQGNGSTGLFERYCAYYMEVPLLPGDYYFGADTSGSSYTYFLYLDIGANAGDGSSEDSEKSPIDFAYFNTSNVLVPIQTKTTTTDSSGKETTTYSNNSNYVYSDAYFAVTGTSSSALKVQFKRTSSTSGTTETITLYYYYSPTDVGVTTTANKSGVATQVTDNPLISGS